MGSSPSGLGGSGDDGLTGLVGIGDQNTLGGSGGALSSPPPNYGSTGDYTGVLANPNAPQGGGSGIPADPSTGLGAIPDPSIAQQQAYDQQSVHQQEANWQQNWGSEYGGDPFNSGSAYMQMMADGGQPQFIGPNVSGPGPSLSQQWSNLPTLTGPAEQMAYYNAENDQQQAQGEGQPGGLGFAISSNPSIYNAAIAQYDNPSTWGSPVSYNYNTSPYASYTPSELAASPPPGSPLATPPK